MNYQGYLIAPFNVGLDTDAEPWLLPNQAFTTLENVFVRHNFIEKRGGYRVYGRFVEGRAITAATTADPAVFTVATATGLSDGDTVTLSYMTGGTWNTLNGAEYTIDNLSGSTFELLDSTGTAVDGSGLGTYTSTTPTGRLGYYETDRIMGIDNFVEDDLTKQIIVSNTKRVCRFNTSSQLFEPLDAAESTTPDAYPDNDVWSSSDTDYIWSVNWQSSGVANRLYMSNGKAYQSGTPGTDGIWYYDNTALTGATTYNSSAPIYRFQPSLGGSNLLYGARHMYVIKDRLLCLYTFEYNGSSTDTHPQRARWCAIQSPSNWDSTTPGGGGFVDAPTGERIISARQVQDVIIVLFNRSVWYITATADPALPFKWVKVNNFRACDAKMGSVEFDRYILSVGKRGVIISDTNESRRVDERIFDFVSNEINDDEFDKSFGVRDFNNERTYLLYAEGEDDDAKSGLIYNEESKSFSKIKFSESNSMNVLGYGVNAVDYAAQDFTADNNLDVSANDLDDETAYSFFWGDKSELLIGGDRGGYLYFMDDGTSDNGTSIAVTMESAGWNPFMQQGQECQFGYMDIYADSDKTTNLQIQFKKNDNEFPYKTVNCDLLPNLNFLAQVSSITPNADPSTGYVIIANSHGLSADDIFYLYNCLGSDFYNDEPITVSSVTENSITVAQDITEYGQSITGITQANPGVVTSAGHGFIDGDEVVIVNVSGMTEVNGESFTVANATTNTFELSGVDTSGYTAYSSGGYVFYDYLGNGKITERKFYRTKVIKRVYAGGSGYQHRCVISSSGTDDPLRIHYLKPYFRPIGRRVLG